MHWRHEQRTLQMALAAALHHSRDVGPVTCNALRSQRTARAEATNNALRSQTTSVAGDTELCSLCEEELGGTRLDRFTGVRPQVRVLQRTVEQIVDPVPVVPLLCRRFSTSASRPLTFQLHAVVCGVVKVFSQNRVQQIIVFQQRLSSRSLISPFLVEAFKIYAQDRVLRHSPADFADDAFQGFFALFPKTKKRDTTSALGVGTAPALEPMDAGCL